MVALIIIATIAIALDVVALIAFYRLTLDKRSYLHALREQLNSQMRLIQTQERLMQGQEQRIAAQGRWIRSYTHGAEVGTGQAQVAPVDAQDVTVSP